MLIHVLKNGMHSEDYEDLLRCIFGNNAFYMFTIQKILSSVNNLTNLLKIIDNQIN